MKVYKKPMHNCVVDHGDTRHNVSPSDSILIWDLNNELKHWVWDAMLLSPPQPTLASVFQLLEHVKMNVVEE